MGFCSTLISLILNTGYEGAEIGILRLLLSLKFSGTNLSKKLAPKAIWTWKKKKRKKSNNVTTTYNKWKKKLNAFTPQPAVLVSYYGLSIWCFFSYLITHHHHHTTYVTYILNTKVKEYWVVQTTDDINTKHCCYTVEWLRKICYWSWNTTGMSSLKYYCKLHSFYMQSAYFSLR